VSELEILKARVTHLERQLRLREQENQHLRSRLRSPVEQINRRALLQRHKGFHQSEGVDR
jgi:hypothetical protein